jgi:hypothetical protein
MNATTKPTAIDTGTFAHALLDPDIPVPAGLSGPGGGPAERRYGVYRNNVVVGLMDSLAAAFPSTCAVLGEEKFARIARNFVASHPPRSPMMQAYGADFPDFLATFPPLRKAPFLADVARVERAFLDAFHAADAPALTVEELQDIPAEGVAGLSFRLHPAAALIASRFAVFDLFSWRNGRPEGDTDLGNAQCVLVTRPGLEVEVTMLSPSQHALLASMACGTSFGDAAATALADEPNFDLPGTFALALSAGLFLSNRS